MLNGRSRFKLKTALQFNNTFGYSVRFLTHGEGSLFNGEINATPSIATSSSQHILYPIGIQDFEKIRRDGYVYVDKTEALYNLTRHGGYFFLSRPRRFGKSLLVSTMETYFSGKKEYFEGLAIAGLEKEWNRYPVLRMDFSGKAYDNPEVLEQALDESLHAWELQYDVDNKYDVPGIRFGRIIEAAFIKTGRPVVILIDEYDKPIVDNLGNDSLCDMFRKQLQAFYGVMKGKDKYIRFGFLTGVTRIGKLSVFSGLNNLRDISMDSRYVNLCGISNAELRQYFPEGITELAVANGVSTEACYEKLAWMYDGYHFSEDAEGMYNPFSVLSALDSRKFKEFWIETGTPSFLVEVMKQTDYDVTGIASERADSTLLTSIDTVFHNPLPLLYQCGYLTITGYDKESDIYTLGFPNQEVRHGFLSYLLNYYTTSRGAGSLLIRQMSSDLLSGKPEDFMKRMESFFAGQNYQIQGSSEKDFQYAMSVILQLLGDSVTVRTEEPTSDGRIDIAVETPGYVYVIEIKKDDSSDAALRQIEDKGYAKKYESSARRLFKVGVNFSTESRRIDSWKIAD
ncbi:MAG: AAA family ATPase [Bacteroidales bacterium]|nr:AAA family ATPase [Bacteroidales bacterium]